MADPLTLLSSCSSRFCFEIISRLPDIDSLILERIKPVL
jgi:hypothetical protein